MTAQHDAAASCSPECPLPSLGDPWLNGASEGLTYWCPRCGARWEMTARGATGPRRRQPRFKKVAEGNLSSQRQFDASARRTANKGCLIAAILIIGLPTLLSLWLVFGP